MNSVRQDHRAIADWVPTGARVLDLGCGDGTLFAHLMQTRGVSGYGVEILPERVRACVAQGVPVIQTDLESGLSTFASDSFDVVILSLTLQAMRNTELILREMLRVGREAIVTFPNFGYWKNRVQVLAGHMPVSRDIPYQWHDTPNIHLCTLKDFESLCAHSEVAVTERRVLADGKPVTVLTNLLGSLAIYRLARGRAG
jgi:methionine biosynthesis protein MetW